MAIDFPNSPADNEQYTVGDRTWTWNGTYWEMSTSTSTFTAGDSEPVDADPGDIWFDSAIGKTFVNYNGTWVEIGNAATVVDVIADADADTKVQVEVTADSDKIEFTTAGTKRLEIDASGHVIPAANETYDLGSASNRFRDLYLSGTSINLGGAEISSDGTSLTMPPVSNISGDFTVDTNTLHVDSTNDRVGIGTATPSQPLHVEGNALIQSGGLTVNAGGNTVLNRAGASASTAAGGVEFQIDGTTYASLHQPSAGSLSTSANVGIGTATPTASLTVTSGTDDAKVKIDSNGGSVGIIDATANTNDATGRWLSINPSGGNVGIGTTSPGYKLEVDNTLTVKGTSPFLRILETTTVADAHLWLGQDGTIGEGLHVWYESSTGASYIDNIFNNASLYLRTNNGSSTGVGIDVLGRVTTPNQPSFIAYGAGYQSVSSGGDHVLVFETTSINRGGHYSTSTGRFTAPVTGVYAFHLSARIDGISSSSGYYRWAIRKNGTLTWAAPNPHVITSADGVATSYMTKNVSGFVYLSANDYVEAVFNNSGSGVTSGLLKSESQFSGHFIG
jgi:hypothetical protein